MRTWTSLCLIYLCTVLSAFADDAHSCVPQNPVATIELNTQESGAGSSAWVTLPRSASKPDSPSVVDARATWEADSSDRIVVRAEFVNQAAISVDYPVLSVSFTAHDAAGRVLSSETRDFTQACTNPGGLPLFGGDQNSDAKFAYTADPNVTGVTVRIWAGMF